MQPFREIGIKEQSKERPKHMGKGGDTFWDTAMYRRAINRWAISAREASTAKLSVLRKQAARARLLRAHLDQLIHVADKGQYELLGDTLDDAAGEAFDKTAKLLGLPYPGGPSVSRAAEQGQVDRFNFPRPMTDRPGLDFSFSGLKTSVLRTLEKNEEGREKDLKWKQDVCASLQHTIVAILVSRLEKAADRFGRRAIAIQGGVSANSGLRSAIQELGARRGWSVHIPPFQYCTDNGAMIAMSGQFSSMKNKAGGLGDGPLPRWPMT